MKQQKVWRDFVILSPSGSSGIWLNVQGTWFASQVEINTKNDISLLTIQQTARDLM